MGCENCNVISLAAHECAMAREERTQRRLWITVLVLIALCAVSNAFWIVRGAHPVEITQAVEQENDSGNNSFVGGDVNGEAEGNDNFSAECRE